MGNEVLEVLHFDSGTVHIIGCWDNDTKDVEFDFFDLHWFGKDGSQKDLTMGEPFFERPSLNDVEEIIGEKVVNQKTS